MRHRAEHYCCLMSYLLFFLTLPFAFSPSLTLSYPIFFDLQSYILQHQANKNPRGDSSREKKTAEPNERIHLSRARHRRIEQKRRFSRHPSVILATYLPNSANLTHFPSLFFYPSTFLHMQVLYVQLNATQRNTHPTNACVFTYPLILIRPSLPFSPSPPLPSSLL